MYFRCHLFVAGVLFSGSTTSNFNTCKRSLCSRTTVKVIQETFSIDKKKRKIHVTQGFNYYTLSQIHPVITLDGYR